MKNNKLLIFMIISIAAMYFVGFLLEPDEDHTLKAADGIYYGHPLTQFSSDMFAGSGICAFCHSNLRDAKGEDVSIDAHWQSTMMANAAIDPLWQAKVSSEIARNPHLKEVLEEKCSTCHMPMAKTQALVDHQPVKIFGDGFTNENHPLNAAAMDGVSCTLCHQVSASNLGKDESYSGHFIVDSTTSKPSRKIYGPYTNSFSRQMSMMAGFTPVYGAHVSSSEQCATCHTLFTPYVDAKGEIAGEFPEQTPYLEWEHSKYPGEKGKSCQGCHMPEANGAVKISSRGGGMGRGGGGSPYRSPFSEHHFVGGNTFMLNIIKGAAEALQLTSSDQQLDDTIARTINQLTNNTATIKINSARLNDGKIDIRIAVRNKVGHKFPTGIPIRRAWLQVTVKDADGKTVFSSGDYRDDGAIIGNDADKNALAFEPHYSVITREAQVQIYESIMNNSDGAVTYTFLRAAEYAKDNRLLPAGFDKNSANADIAVYGKADSDTDFRGGLDRILYQVNPGKGKAPFTVTAKLLYQSVPYSFIKDLEKDNTKEIRTFARMYKKSDKTPVVIDEAERAVK